MNKRNWSIFGVLTLTVLLAVPFAMAQPMGRHMGDRHQAAMGGFGPLGHLQKLQSQLGLTDDQVSQIKAIFTSLHDQNAAIRQQLKGGRQQILSTLLADPNNVAAAQNILSQQTQAENAMKANALTATAKALSVLTPDQRTKLGQLIAARQAKWANRAK